MEFRKKFGQEKQLEIVEGDICSLPCDAIASPGNSRGDMGGGLDLAVRNRFGFHLEKVLKEKIKECFGGQLPVGKAILISTKDPLIPYFISAPTMVEPGKIKGTKNAEEAMRAILQIAQKNKRIKKVAIPGLGTGVGGLPVEEAVAQMWKAFNETKKRGN